MAGLYSADFSGFIREDTDFALDPPRGIKTPSGYSHTTSWVLNIGTSYPNVILHVADPAKLWELHDLIAATLPPREGDAR